MMRARAVADDHDLLQRRRARLAHARLDGLDQARGHLVQPRVEHRHLAERLLPHERVQAQQPLAIDPARHQAPGQRAGGEADRDRRRTSAAQPVSDEQPADQHQPPAQRQHARRSAETSPARTPPAPRARLARSTPDCEPARVDVPVVARQLPRRAPPVPPHDVVPAHEVHAGAHRHRAAAERRRRAAPQRPSTPTPSARCGAACRAPASRRAPRCAARCRCETAGGRTWRSSDRSR